jgi:hypothetical protein
MLGNLEFRRRSVSGYKDCTIGSIVKLKYRVG